MRCRRAVQDPHVFFCTRAQRFKKVLQNWGIYSTGANGIHVDPTVAPGPPVLHGPYQQGLFGQKIGSPAIIKVIFFAETCDVIR